MKTSGLLTKSIQDLARSAFAKFRTLAFGHLSLEETRQLEEARWLIENGWPGGALDLGPTFAEVKKVAAQQPGILRDLSARHPESRRSMLNGPLVREAVALERQRNINLRKMRYFDEIRTEDLNLKTARKFCESDIEGRLDWADETDEWRKQKFPGIDDEEVRREASCIWRWSGLSVAAFLTRRHPGALSDEDVKHSLREAYRPHLMMIWDEEIFLRRIDTIGKVASFPIPRRMKAYAEYMREPSTVEGFVSEWRAMQEERFGWINRVEKAILRN
jgi:hypothetical protein